ncbi:RluA family pseudouridine synthase [Polaromonas sp. YR568]|uniref:RluA family pseudouridine synthase n=1 Tax=Polaromonas sp. YR568 TaxID=1855301 RepID=UPI003137B2E6
MTDSGSSGPIISGVRGDFAMPADAHDDPEGVELVDQVEHRDVVVPSAQHGARLDLALATLVPEFSRSYLQQLIAAGVVQLAGRVQAKSSAKVKAGDALQIELRPTPQSQAFKPEPMALDVVYEDDSLLVINKPAGLVVHPAPGNWSGTLLNGLLARDAQAACLPRAGIVHRLDKDTSGLMVVAKQRVVMDRLVEMIAARTVHREYVAIAHGAWVGAPVRQVEAPIGRDPRNRLRMAVVDMDRHSGKSASTRISLMVNAARHCLVACRLQTGRTHQIRVHMVHIGHPLVSDALYGGEAAGGLTRQALHACRLAFEHPVSGQAVDLRVPPPDDFQSAAAALGLGYNWASSHL